MATKPNGIIIYRGPSMLDGKPIIAIATGLAGASRNSKTGDLVQTWILRDDVSPTEAVNTGDDASICGACPHRGTIENGKNVGRSCYVTVFQAPLNVWKAAQRGGYVEADAGALIEAGAGRMVRIGSYGDPAAVPLLIWAALTRKAVGWTGYTHQWRTANPAYAEYCMASCDDAGERFLAKAAGYRTFRVREQDGPAMAKEVICPASEEMGKRTNCATCRACGGLGAKAKADIVITVHGPAGKVNAMRKRAA